MTVTAPDAPAPAPLNNFQAGGLLDTLDRVVEVLEELDTTITRTDAMAPERLGSSGHKVRVVPYNQTASDARTELERVLRVHAVQIAGYLGVEVLPGPRHHARFLRHHAHHMVGLDGTSVIYSDVQRAAASAWRAVDRRPERVFLGKCSCGEDLQTTRRAHFTKCVGCGTRHDVAQRRTDMLAAARDRTGTAAELAKILPWFAGNPIKANTINQWAARGRLQGETVGNRTVYRIGDVLDLHKQATDLAQSAGRIAATG